MLVYAGPGIGKTTLCGSAVDVPEMRDILLLSAEKGEMALFDNKMVKNPELIDNIPINTFRQMSYIKDFLQAHCIARDKGDTAQLKKMQDNLFGEGGDDRIREYRTVIVDSLNEIETMNMYELLSVDPNGANSLTSEMPTAEFKEYKQNNNRMQLLIRALRDLPMHVLVICHQQYDQDEMKRMKFTLNLTGKLSTGVQGFFDVVGFLTASNPTEEKEAPRRLWVQPVGGKFDAKNRRASMKEAFFDDPTMITIMKKIGLAK